MKWKNQYMQRLNVAFSAILFCWIGQLSYIKADIQPVKYSDPEPIFRITVNPASNTTIDTLLGYKFNSLELFCLHPTDELPTLGNDLLPYYQYIKSLGAQVTGKKPTAQLGGGYSTILQDLSVCKMADGSDQFPCMASDELVNAYAEESANAVNFLQPNDVRYFDESVSTTCYYHSKTKFPLYLASKNYTPSVFNSSWSSWNDMIVPTADAVDSNPTLGMRKLEYEYHLWAEQNFLDLMQAACAQVKNSHQQTRNDIGILSPGSLYFGYHANVPFSRLSEIQDANYVEIDFYEATLTGGHVTPPLFYTLEAACQLATDITRMPLLITENLIYEGRTEEQIKLLSVLPAIQVDNMAGMNYYYYCNDAIPRLPWVEETFERIKSVYSLFREYKEINRILVVIEDPIYNGRGHGVMNADGTMTFDWNYADRIADMVGAYQFVSQMHKDADFATPRTLATTDLSGYDVIIAQSQHISDNDFQRLIDWTTSFPNRGLLYIQSASLNLDEYGTNKSTARFSALQSHSNAKYIPTSFSSFATLVNSYVTGSLFVPAQYYTNVDIDARVNATNNDRLFTVANYETTAQTITFTVNGDWRQYQIESKFSSSTSLTLDVSNSTYATIVVTIPPSEVDVLLLSAGCPGVIQAGLGMPADLNHDCHVDFKDIAIFAESWLLCNNPDNPSCVTTW